MSALRLVTDVPSIVTSCREQPHETLWERLSVPFLVPRWVVPRERMGSLVRDSIELNSRSADCMACTEERRCSAQSFRILSRTADLVKLGSLGVEAQNWEGLEGEVSPVCANRRDNLHQLL